jgi:hypothetical protein
MRLATEISGVDKMYKNFLNSISVTLAYKNVEMQADKFAQNVAKTRGAIEENFGVTYKYMGNASKAVFDAMAEMNIALSEGGTDAERILRSNADKIELLSKEKEVYHNVDVARVKKYVNDILEQYKTIPVAKTETDKKIVEGQKFSDEQILSQAESTEAALLSIQSKMSDDAKKSWEDKNKYEQDITTRHSEWKKQRALEDISELKRINDETKAYKDMFSGGNTAESDDYQKVVLQQQITFDLKTEYEQQMANESAMYEYHKTILGYSYELEKLHTKKMSEIEEKAINEKIRLKQKDIDITNEQMKTYSKAAENTMTLLTEIAKANKTSAADLKTIRIAEILMNGAGASIAAMVSIWSDQKSEMYTKIGLTIGAAAAISSQTAAALVAVNSAYARGTDYHRGNSRSGLSLVGEEGPELVQLNTGSSVATARETAAAMAGLRSNGGGLVSTNTAGSGATYNFTTTINAGSNMTSGDLRRLQRESDENTRKTITRLINDGTLPRGIVLS